MHLNVFYAIDHLDMCSHLLCHIRASHCIDRKPHRKQTVRISAKRLSVKEIPPASQHLSV